MEHVLRVQSAAFRKVRLLQSLGRSLHHRRKTREPAVPTQALPPAVILVVDDEPTVNRLVSRYLTHLGYRVMEASS